MRTMMAVGSLKLSSDFQAITGSFRRWGVGEYWGWGGGINASGVVRVMVPSWVFHVLL